MARGSRCRGSRRRWRRAIGIEKRCRKLRGNAQVVVRAYERLGASRDSSFLVPSTGIRGREYPGVVETIDTTPVRRTPSLARRARRVAANVVLVIGVGVLVWTFVVWQWNDPFTSLYTRWEQHKLAATHEKIVKEYTPKRSIPASATPQEEAAQIREMPAGFARAQAKGHRSGGSSCPDSTSTCS